jgi:hypothetical protein
MDFSKANQTLLEVTESYQNIKFGDKTVAAPYFINFAELVYKQAMSDFNLSKEDIRDVLKPIREGKTGLGSKAGKGSPEDLNQDVVRLLSYIKTWGFEPKRIETVRRWMVMMHIGLDCSGYVYNVIKAIEEEQKIDLLSLMSWADPTKMIPSYAGAFIFNSDKLIEITDVKTIKPMDILIYKDNTHVGLIANYKGELCLADCSMSRDVSLRKITFENNKVLVEDSEDWTENINAEKVTIRRFHS